MELNHHNPSGEVVLPKNPNPVKKKFENFWKFNLKMSPISCFFEEDAYIAQKTRLSITFSLFL